MLTVSNTYKTTIKIDGEPIAIRVKKFTKEDALWFHPTFERIKRDEAAALDELQRFAVTYRRKQAEHRGVPEDQIEARFDDWFLVGLIEAELGPEKTAERRAREDTRQREGDAFAIAAIGRFVTFDRGQIFDEDAGREIVNGEDLATHFIARRDVIIELLAQISLENQLSPEQKKRLSLLSASTPTSPASETDDGPRPDATAGSVAPSTTAPTAPAPDRPDASLSGATTASTPTSVPS
jgi:hypothetical protein